MIVKLDHTNPAVAEKIRLVFQISYVVEAELIGATYFPPLKRPLTEFMITQTQFYGLHQQDELAAVIEIKTDKESTLIQSLVVDPKFFRQGLGGKLVRFALDNFSAGDFYVETGAANDPAILLYEKFGFKETKQYDTAHGIRKIRLAINRES